MKAHNSAVQLPPSLKIP